MRTRRTLPRPLVGEQLEDRRLLTFNPTAAEQELLQLVNRVRTDPRGEFTRLISRVSPITARDAIFQTELDFFRVNGSILQSELAALSPAPPVAWNAAVQEFTAGHNARMLATSPPSQFHSSAAARRQALLDAGVPLRIVSGETIHSENVYGYAKSPMHLFASYIVDWGNGTGGMQTDRPHRRTIMNPHFDQIGHSISGFSGSNFGPLVNTQVLVNIQNPPVMVIGAVFEDKNGSGWYEAGEGIGAATIEFTGAGGTFTTQSWSAGGYQIELPAGTYTARATGRGMAHPTIVSNIVVGSNSVWQNLIYDPAAIPPDSLEPNNTAATATATTGRDQTFSGLSIHTASDVDWFRFMPVSTGEATFRIQFSHAAGNLDMSLHNASQGTLVTANSTANSETIKYTVTRGTTYFLRVYSVGGATNGNYTLTIDAPEPQRPVAVSDRTKVSSASRTVSIDVLANDLDPDGDRTKLVPRLASNAPAAFTLDANRRVVFTMPANAPSGFMRTTYTVTDDQDLVSAPANIDVMMVNFSHSRPWQNQARPFDVNGDGQITPLDILTIVNDLNTHGVRSLPTSGSILAFQGLLDTNGDNMVTALDILLVVNHLNRSGAGEGEALELDPHVSQSHDRALLSLMWDVEEVREKSKAARA
jgi:hypothetical protein